MTPEESEICWCTHPAADHDAGECWAEVDAPDGRGQCACNWWEPVAEVAS